jgi:hypothetical protein
MLLHQDAATFRSYPLQLLRIAYRRAWVPSHCQSYQPGESRHSFFGLKHRTNIMITFLNERFVLS